MLSDELNLGDISFQLSDPQGRSLVAGLTSGGHLFELASAAPIDLESDGLYASSLDGSNVAGT